jgi:hypothetical protein
MTIKEYLQDKTLVSLQTANDILLGITTSEGSVQVNSDTSSLLMGAPIIGVTSFTLEEDLIKTETTEYNTTELSVSLPEENI